MDKLLRGIRALFSKPGRPAGTRVDPVLIAKRAPDLVRRLLQGAGPGDPLGRTALDVGTNEFERLIRNLTPAQKTAVRENLNAYRSYFRQARRARLAGMAARGARAGAPLLAGATLGAGAQQLLYPRVRGMLPGIDEGSEEQLLQLQRSLEGPSTLTEAAREFNEAMEFMDRRKAESMGRSEGASPQLNLFGVDPRDLSARPPRQGSYRDAAERGLASMQAGMSSPETREEDFQRSVRATQAAIPALPSPRLRVPEIVSNAVSGPARREAPRQRPASDPAPPREVARQELPADQVEQIISTLKLSDPALRRRSFIPSGRPRMGAGQIPATRMRFLGGPSIDIPVGATEAEVEAMFRRPGVSETDLERYLSFRDQQRRGRRAPDGSGETGRERIEREFYEGMSPDGIRVPKVVRLQHQQPRRRSSRGRPRRRLQPTAPGIFGELLDESITDFQGAPMMSEREILRMIRGE